MAIRRSWPITCALLLLASCTEPAEDSEGETTAASSCADELIGEWESVEEYPCQNGEPDCTARHELSFDEMGFMYIEADYGFGGSYTCEDGEFEDLAGELSGTYDAEADELEVMGPGEQLQHFRRKMP